ncbi:MAG: enoyl-CoA hydratase/isomerase family protein [Alphaproteobacteria bacterium]|jgi:enoyl-CoA hydratase/carnithine racemase|nr:enoyl-CoA hydratase/isomerase family protein [Alphaproteobacteria bacterium]|tara:strand:+ start:717 stop:1520 length:804 start_codon:yes stop_codon:yes gene_type:complete
MDYQNILFEQRGAVGLMTLNRPEKMNAWTHDMRDELLHAMDRVNNDPHMGAMVLTGAGRGFCAGADIGAMFKKQLDDAGGGDAAARPPSTAAKWVKAVRAAKPMIAAVNGAAVGVGLTQILPCDYIMTSEKAKFCCAFVKMGVVTELASSHYLVQRMGWGNANEAALTARMIPGEEAVRLGLADRLVPHDDLVDEAVALAGLMAQNPSRQLRMVKELLSQNGSESDLDKVLQRETVALELAYKSPEHAEAVNAFLEKRPPDFRKVSE